MQFERRYSATESSESLIVHPAAERSAEASESSKACSILRLGRPLKDISTSIENVANLEISMMEKNLSILATISGAAPMIGFLGTVIGMIIAFHEMASAGG